MGLAFELSIRTSRRERWLAGFARLLAASGAGLSAVHLAAGPTAVLDGPPALQAAVATGLALFSVLLLADGLRILRSGLAPPSGQPDRGSLRVDDTGACMLDSSDRGGEPATLVRACILPGLILVSLAPSAVGSVLGPHWRCRTLLLGRDAMSLETWRRLNAWLLWCSRGRRDRPTGWKRR
jgi:hypothetical protein